MKLTKKEKDFLIDWLSDDLDLAVMNRDTSSNIDALAGNPQAQASTFMP